MSNITLHPLWLTAMPAYERVIGMGTLLYSSLAFYLMIAKTPKVALPFTRYLMLLQASITLVDVTYGILFRPVSLMPAPGCLCYGIICSWFGWSGHVGNSLLACALLFGVVCVLYCFHYKYVSIRQMTGGDSSQKCRHIVFRLAMILVFSVPSVADLLRYRYYEDGSNYPSLYYLFESPVYPSYSYDPTLCPTLRLVFLASWLINIFIAALIVTYFVVSTFAHLAKQNSLSEKTRRMQQKSMILLVVQTIPPLAIQMAPIIFYSASYFFIKANPNISNALICFQLTHSFVYTTILILSTPSYREPFIFWQKKKTSVSSLYTPRSR